MVQLLGSHFDSVLPGVRYLCVVPSLLFVRPWCQWAYFYDLFLFSFFSLRSLLVITSLSFFFDFLCYLGLYSLLSLSRVFFFCLAWLMSSALLYEVSNADRGVIVYCPLRKSLGCLNWLVYLALPGEVSIAGRGVIVYCLLRKSPGCLNWLVYLALPGEVSIAGRGVIVYCLLRKSPGCLNRLMYMALLGEVSIG